MKKLLTFVMLFVSLFTVLAVANTKDVEAANTDNSKEKWSAIGTINGTSWNKDFPLEYNSTNDRYELEIALTAGNEFKIRLNNAWTTSIGYGGNTGAGISTYLSQSGQNFKVKTTGNYILWVKDDKVANYGDKSYGFGIDKAAEVKYVDITYYAKDGSVHETETVIEGSVFNPKFVEEEGFRLEGWYTDKDLTQKINKGDKVTKALNLYPKYAEASDYVIYFVDEENALGTAPKAYMWSNEVDNNNAWPGVALENAGERGWKITVDASKSFDNIIFNNGLSDDKELKTVDLVLTLANANDTFVLGDKNENGHYVANVEATGTNYTLQDLVSEYYNNGVYTRNTTIYLNDESLEELRTYFHANVTLLERTTYFKNDELWMSKENGLYSYYGSQGGNLTWATTDKLETPEASVAKANTSMEEHYTTLFDIKGLNVEWTYENGVYTSTDAAAKKAFLDFTAPCFLNFNAENANYLLLTKVTVEKTEAGLVLRLWADTTDAAGKFTSEGGLLSEAIIPLN